MLTLNGWWGGGDWTQSLLDRLWDCSDPYLFRQTRETSQLHKTPTLPTHTSAPRLSTPTLLPELKSIVTDYKVSWRVREGSCGRTLGGESGWKLPYWPPLILVPPLSEFKGPSRMEAPPASTGRPLAGSPQDITSLGQKSGPCPAGLSCRGRYSRP